MFAHRYLQLKLALLRYSEIFGLHKTQIRWDILSQIFGLVFYLCYLFEVQGPLEYRPVHSAAWVSLYFWGKK